MSVLHTLTLAALLNTLPNDLFSQDPFEYKNRGNREEGRRPIGVGAQDLQLLSFVSYIEKVDLDTNVNLKIRFYTTAESQVYISAKELQGHEFYEMKPLQHNWSPGWQEFQPWPTDEVLRPLGLKPNHLGFVARLNQDRSGSGEIVPLLVYHHELPPVIENYSVYLLAQEALRKVEVRLYAPEQETPMWVNQIREVFGAAPFSIQLNLPDQSPGWYKLIIDCRYRNRIGGPQRTYTFYHNPIIEK